MAHYTVLDRLPVNASGLKTPLQSGTGALQLCPDVIPSDLGGGSMLGVDFLSYEAIQWVSPIQSIGNFNYYDVKIGNLLARLSQIEDSDKANAGLTAFSKRIAQKIPFGFPILKRSNIELGKDKIGNIYLLNPNVSATQNIGNSTSYYYGGLGDYQPNDNISVERVTFYFNLGTGDISAKQLYCQIWTIAGTSLDTMLAESPGVYCQDYWSISYPAIVNFFFSSPVSLLSSGTYAIVATMKEVDASNYPRFYRGPAALPGVSGGSRAYSNVGARIYSNSFHPSMKVFIS